MKNKLIILVITLVFTAALISACKTDINDTQPAMSPTYTENPISPFPGSPTINITTPIELPNQDKFRFYRAIWNRDSIYLFGTADMPEGTRLQIQLYKDHQAVTWWVGVRSIFVHGGKWDTSIQRGNYQVPVDQFPEFEPGYSFRIWDLFNAEMIAEFSLPYPEPEPAVIATLEGSQWKLISMDGQDILDNSYISLYFWKNGVKGNGSINFYGGKYWTDNPNKLFVYDFKSTEMGGDPPGIQQEGIYYKYLYGADTYQIIDGHLELFDSQGHQTLVFERIPEHSLNPADLLDTEWELIRMNGQAIVDGLSITLDFDTQTCEVIDSWTARERANWIFRVRGTHRRLSVIYISFTGAN